MGNKMNYVRLFVALLLLTAGLAHMTAGPPYQYWRTYYTDSSKTVECGYANVACGGTTYSGCWTAYHDDEFVAYCGGSGSDCEEYKESSECADNFDNDSPYDGQIDMEDPSCWPCYSRFETF